MTAAAVRFAQMEVTLPEGWEARGYARLADEDERTYGVLHIANFALPAQVADYGGGAVELMGRGHAFISIVEFGPESVGSPLFAATAIPTLTTASFDTARLQRGLAGHSGAQEFFTVAGRAYCLYVVVGEHLLRWRVVPAVNEVLRNVQLG
ncbi:MAG: hypothetical protein AB7L84_07700 [Acidimicrobiia bacterium]